MAAMPVRWAQARHPFIYEINTWPWLAELSETAGVPVDLSTVPEAWWDAIANAGFDAVWLMGVWERSPAGVAIALADHDLVAAFRAALPDLAPQDVVGSPYCIRNYVVDMHLGGRTGLAVARTALAERGVALILDFVPNHVAPDHPWITAHPEHFVEGTSQDLLSDPGAFIDVEGRVLARGKDPYFPAWPDVVQLDAFSPTLRRAIVETLRDIAGQCDGVRCDMAMLVINDVFAGTWGDYVGDKPAEEYWPMVIDAVHQSHPDFSFIAEAYWGMEYALQQQGFEFCYDKTLYDHLVAGDARAVREHLSADAGFLQHLLSFVENHDESRAAAVFDPARQMAVTLTMLTQAGARLLHDGQLTGRKVHLPVFLGRAPRESVDAELEAFHRSLLDVLRDSTFRVGEWNLCGILDRPGDASSDNLVAWCWDGDRRWLIVVNLSAASASGRIVVPWADVVGGTFRLSDPLTGHSIVSPSENLRTALDVELGPWQWHLFDVVPM